MKRVKKLIVLFALIFFLPAIPANYAVIQAEENGGASLEEIEEFSQKYKLFDDETIQNVYYAIQNGELTRPSPLTDTENRLLQKNIVQIKNGESVDLDGEGVRESVTVNQNQNGAWILSAGEEEIVCEHDSLTGELYGAAISSEERLWNSEFGLQLIQLILPFTDKNGKTDQAEVYWYAFGKLLYLDLIPMGKNGIASLSLVENGIRTSEPDPMLAGYSYHPVEYTVSSLERKAINEPRLARRDNLEYGLDYLVRLNYDLELSRSRYDTQDTVTVPDGEFVSIVYCDGEQFLYIDSDKGRGWLKCREGRLLSGGKEYRLEEMFAYLPEPAAVE